MVEIPGSGELKSKPVQHSVRELNSLGIQPDVLVCRSTQPLTEEIKNKIALLCDIDKRAIIENLTAGSIYEVPLLLEKEGFTDIVCEKLHLPISTPDLVKWTTMVEKIKNAYKKVKIALVGKYTELHDAYLSVGESIFHAASALDAKADIIWVNSEELSEENVSEKLKEADGIIIPGGFGVRGIEGMVAAAKYAREKNLPCLGICLGMQIMVIEYARNVLGYADANSTEFDETTTHPVIDFLPEQVNIIAKGATMRLGSYPCTLQKDSIVISLYNKDVINERHRHRYEFNNIYRQDFINGGLKLSGLSPNKTLVEIVELPTNRYYVGSQFHPEFKSRPTKPHPLFTGLIMSSLEGK